ncbi:MAG TPA: hypothetical protein VMT92_01390 [Steroidobacteraceae bacterium]|nr:hypothetical protein [Steroidobacteraceae bacterium]
MRSTARLCSVLAVALAFASLPALAADAPATAAPAAAPGDRPENGMKMSDVEARYGAPATRYPAVGQPPITRWDYPGMVVYFEFDRVLHAVLVTSAG